MERRTVRRGVKSIVVEDEVAVLEIFGLRTIEMKVVRAIGT